MHLEIARLARNSLIYGVGQILTRFISLLLLPLFTSYLTPSDYGVSSILGLMTFFLGPIFALGLGTAVGLVYFETGDRSARDATIWSALALLGLSAAVMLAVGIFFEAPLAQFLFPSGTQGYDYAYLIDIVLATSALGILSQPLFMYLQLEERAATFVVLTLSSSIVTILLSILFVVEMHRGVQGMLEAQLLGQAVATIMALIPVVRGVRISFRASTGGRLLRLGVPLIPSFVFVFIMLQVNKYLIQIDLGLDAVGVYTIGYNFGLFLSLLVGGFTNAWYPFFMSFQERQDEAKALFGRIFSYYMIGIGSLSLLFYLAARPAVLILTHGIAYREAYVVVGPSATAQFLVGSTSILLAGMFLARQVHYQVLVQGVAAAIAIVLNLALIPLMGIPGAAIALASGYAIVSLLQHLWNLRAGYLAVEYEWSRVCRFIALYVVYALLFSMQRDLPLLLEVGASAIGMAVLAIYVYWLLLPRERELLWQLAGRLARRAQAVVPTS